MTSSYVPRTVEKSSSYDYLRERASQADAAALEQVDADKRYNEQQAANADEILAKEQAQVEQGQQGTLKAAEQSSAPNPLQEVGTALVGGAIDAVESVGGTVEQLVKGQALNDNFKPTWLQVADEQEPLNRTVWGNVIRGIAEYGTLMLLTRKAVKGAKVAKIPGATKLSQALDANNAKTAAGKWGRTAVKGAGYGAVADFVGSYSEGETISTELNKMFPALPDWLVTQEDDSPLERRLKNVVEGMGGGIILEGALGWRAAKKAAQELQNLKPAVADQILTSEKELIRVSEQMDAKVSAYLQKVGKTKLDADDRMILSQDPEYQALKQARTTAQKTYDEFIKKYDPESVADAKVADNVERRQANFDEKAKQAFMDDPEGLEPNAFVNPQLFDAADYAVLSPAKGGYYNSLRAAYQMDTDGLMNRGRRPSVYTEAALEKRLSKFDPERRQVIEKIAKELEVELNNARSVEGKTSAMGGYSVEQLKRLSTARYIDLLDEVVKSDDDVARLKELLEPNSNLRFNDITGNKDSYLNLTDHRAVEMLIHTTAGEISDLANAGRTIHGILDTTNQRDMLLNRMKFMLAETGRSKYIRGFELNGLRNDPAAFQAGIAKIDDNVQRFTEELKNLFDNDPEMMRHYFDILTLADGSVKSLDEMYKFAKDHVFNWQSLVGGKRSAFVDALQSVAINGLLSGPKTIARATLGNGLMIYMRPLQAVLGGALSGDQKAMAMGLSTLRTAFEATGDAWTVARKAWVAGAQGIDMPYQGTARIPATMTSEWKNVGQLIERKGTTGEKMMYRFTTALYDFNNWIGVKYPMVAMGSIDSATSTIMGRMDAKINAFGKAWDETGGQNMKELIAKYEDEFTKEIFDPASNMLRSEYAVRMADEAGLKLPLGPNLQKVDNLIQQIPLLRPFFLFMKTGVNALEVVKKHTPILARFNAEYQKVMSASVDNMEELLPYGIRTPQQLVEAQAVMKGRIATGYLTIGSAIGLYMNGGLTGNGPFDKEERNVWLQTGWRPRSIKIGDKWVSYDSMEPFTSFLAMVGDIGDNANMIGEPAMQGWFGKLSALVASNVTNKSFLSGIIDLNDMLSLQPGRQAVWMANFVNNQMPWGGIRNEIANVFNPGMRELNYDFSNFMQMIQNRNPVLRGELPVKYDILDGSVVRMSDPMTRFFNAVSPIQINFTDTPARRMLRESGYDVASTFKRDSNGTPLDPAKRSRLQNLIGQQQIEAQLNQLFNDPAVKKEMEYYRKLRDLGYRNTDTSRGGDAQYGIDVKDSNYYKSIDQIFRNAKRIAEAQLNQEYPDLRRADIERSAIEFNQKQNNPQQAIEQIIQFKNK